MVTSPLAQRLYDKTKVDLRDFRAEAVQWHMAKVDAANVYSGTLMDVFSQNGRQHLERKVAEYFEWTEKEALAVSPSALRQESVEQCVGAIVTYRRQVRATAMELNGRWQGFSGMVEIGQWDSVNETFIIDRGAKLLSALGLGSDARWTERLNHFYKDNSWFFHTLSVAAFVISVAAFVRSG
jgi:hypothetical protein